MATCLSVPMVAPSVLANEENTEKEEVVYVNLNGDGSVERDNVGKSIPLIR